MGVNGLTSFIEKHENTRETTKTLGERKGSPNEGGDKRAVVVVVDGGALNSYIFQHHAREEGLGLVIRSNSRVYQGTLDFVEQFRKCGLQLIVVQDGASEGVKRLEKIRRMERRLNKAVEDMGGDDSGAWAVRLGKKWVKALEENKGSQPPPPSFNSSIVSEALRDAKVQKVKAIGEADAKLVLVAREHKAAFVLSSDSDFFLLPCGAQCEFIPIHSLKFLDHRITGTAFSRQTVAELLGVPASHFPAVACLFGCDFLDKRLLLPFYDRLKDKHAQRNPDGPKLDWQAAHQQALRMLNKEARRRPLRDEANDEANGAHPEQQLEANLAALTAVFGSVFGYDGGPSAVRLRECLSMFVLAGIEQHVTRNQQLVYRLLPTGMAKRPDSNVLQLLGWQSGEGEGVGGTWDHHSGTGVALFPGLNVCFNNLDAALFHLVGVRASQLEMATVRAGPVKELVTLDAQQKQLITLLQAGRSKKELLAGCQYLDDGFYDLHVDVTPRLEEQEEEERKQEKEEGRQGRREALPLPEWSPLRAVWKANWHQSRGDRTQLLLKLCLGCYPGVAAAATEGLLALAKEEQERKGKPAGEAGGQGGVLLLLALLHVRALGLPFFGSAQCSAALLALLLAQWEEAVGAGERKAREGYLGHTAIHVPSVTRAELAAMELLETAVVKTKALNSLCRKPLSSVRGDLLFPKRLYIDARLYGEGRLEGFSVPPQVSQTFERLNNVLQRAFPPPTVAAAVTAAVTKRSSGKRRSKGGRRRGGRQDRYSRLSEEEEEEKGEEEKGEEEAAAGRESGGDGEGEFPHPQPLRSSTDSSLAALAEGITGLLAASSIREYASLPPRVSAAWQADRRSAYLPQPLPEMLVLARRRARKGVCNHWLEQGRCRGDGRRNDGGKRGESTCSFHHPLCLERPMPKCKYWMESPTGCNAFSSSCSDRICHKLHLLEDKGALIPDCKTWAKWGVCRRAGCGYKHSGRVLVLGARDATNIRPSARGGGIEAEEEY